MFHNRPDSYLNYIIIIFNIIIAVIIGTGTQLRIRKQLPVYILPKHLASTAKLKRLATGQFYYYLFTGARARPLRLDRVKGEHFLCDTSRYL